VVLFLPKEERGWQCSRDNDWGGVDVPQRCQAMGFIEESIERSTK